ncbi:hypothetical protein ACOSQ2_006643 [Xanthoceras sorbifolium]
MTEMTKTARTETRDEQEQRAETRDEWEKTLQLIGVVGLSQLASDLADFGVMFEFLVRGAVLYYSSSRFPSIISYEIVYKFSIANCTNSLLSGFLVPPPTIYRRVASYEDPEDFRQDVRLLLAPVRLGTEAFSLAAGKLETNGNGLPTPPSSTDVQNRVLQAAAKHESQPSDTEGIQEQSLKPLAPMNENVDLSEA